jgi:hypothetical protein
MDKADFIKIAPAYYATAVMLELSNASGYMSEESLQDTPASTRKSATSYWKTFKSFPIG